MRKYFGDWPNHFVYGYGLYAIHIGETHTNSPSDCSPRT